MESDRNLELVRFFFGNNFMAQQLYLLSDQATLAFGAIKHKPAAKVMQIQPGIWLCYVMVIFGGRVNAKAERNLTHTNDHVFAFQKDRCFTFSSFRNWKAFYHQNQKHCTGLQAEDYILMKLSPTLHLGS